MLTGSGLSSEQAAVALISNVRSGFAWLLLKLGISADAVFESQNISYSSDPHQTAAYLSKSFGVEIEGPVDSLIDGTRTAVYLTEKTMRVVTIGQPTRTVVTPCQLALDVVTEGLSFPKSEALAED